MILAAPYLTEPPLYLSYLPGRSDRLVISFSGVGLDEEAVPEVEAARLSGWQGENHVLFVSDASRSWMNHPGLLEKTIAAVEKLTAEIQPARIVGIGNSMGGSAALIYAAHARLDAVLAIVPQYSVNPEVMPRDQRWTRFSDKIAQWPHPVVPDLSGRDTQVIMLHGSVSPEMMHAKRFAQSPNVHHYIFKDFAHGMAFRLKRKGQLEPITAPLIAGDIPTACRAAEAAGGVLFNEFKRLRKAAKAKEIQL